MSWYEFFNTYVVLVVGIALCRLLPLLLMKGRQLPARVEDALSLIPVAAFAALVANDLFQPGMFSAGVWQGVLPLVASALVVVVARKTRSLVWSALVGVAAYALLSLI